MPPHVPSTYGAPMVFTTMRHATSLRSSNNCKCLIETFFIARGERPLHKRLNPCGAFGRVPLLEYGGLKPILPFFEGRSDAACRVVIRLRNSRRCLRGVNDGRYGNPPNDLPAMRTVGAGSSRFSRRFPRPPQYTYTTPPMSPAVLSRRGTPRRYGLREMELLD